MFCNHSQHIYNKRFNKLMDLIPSSNDKALLLKDNRMPNGITQDKVIALFKVIHPYITSHMLQTSETTEFDQTVHSANHLYVLDLWTVQYNHGC